MTDHAAEAHKYIRELQKRPNPLKDTAYSTPEVNAELVALATLHTLQAVLEALTQGIPARCDALHYYRTGEPTQCIHPRGHSSNHEGETGRQW